MARHGNEEENDDHGVDDKQRAPPPTTVTRHGLVSSTTAATNNIGETSSVPASILKNTIGDDDNGGNDEETKEEIGQQQQQRQQQQLQRPFLRTKTESTTSKVGFTDPIEMPPSDTNNPPDLSGNYYDHDGLGTPKHRPEEDLSGQTTTVPHRALEDILGPMSTTGATMTEDGSALLGDVENDDNDDDDDDNEDDNDDVWKTILSSPKTTTTATTTTSRRPHHRRMDTPMIRFDLDTGAAVDRRQAIHVLDMDDGDVNDDEHNPNVVTMTWKKLISRRNVFAAAAAATAENHHADEDDNYNDDSAREANKATTTTTTKNINNNNNKEHQQQGVHAKTGGDQSNNIKEDNQDDEEKNAIENNRDRDRLRKNKKERTYRITSCTEKNSPYSYGCCFKISKHYSFTRAVNEMLRWTFRASFTKVTVVAYLVFVYITCIFALMVFWIGQYRPKCISVAGTDFLEAGTLYMDAFHLSWTTLSTVGYGVIGPLVPTEPGQSRCVGINFLMALESFVGVLFAGTCSAILVGKVARIQSTAPVIFSFPICVRYGTGVMEREDPLAAENNKDNKDKKQQRPAGHRRTATVESVDDPDQVNLPCPILEFRMVNEMSAIPSGEIMNACVHVVATTVKDEEEAVVRVSAHPPPSSVGKLSAAVAGDAAVAAAKAIGRAGDAIGSATVQASKAAAKGTVKVPMHIAKGTGAALLGTSRMVAQGTGSIIQRLNHRLNRPLQDIPGTSGGPTTEEEILLEMKQEVESEFTAKVVAQIEKQQEKLASVTEAVTSVAVIEDNSNLVPQRIFHKLEIETDNHPFFKRQWTIRHRLDETSPLLSPAARDMIAENNGFWPHELNDHFEVRKHLKFSEIICSFSGTANGSGSSVYAQKVYDYADVNIGYAFASVLALNQIGILIADKALIHDVIEQKGGGAEPFVDTVEEGVGEFVTQLAEDTKGQVQQFAENTAAFAKDAGTHMVQFAGEAGEKLQRTISNRRNLGRNRELSELSNIPEVLNVEFAGADDELGAIEVTHV